MASPPIPNRPNPKPRNSEAVDPLRRSFGGNPFPATPKLNIPSDVSRRNSFGGRDFSDKENETKALPTPKGSKNFMSPTISAVSKINPSPRKRVLSDKNQVSRSLSDAKGLTFEEDTKPHHQAKSCVSFSDVIDIIGTTEKKPFERPHDMTVTDFDESDVHADNGIVYSDPRFRISPRPTVPYTSPEFADREVDSPLLPPYDPKKNYLSPRPQLLHYRPNARVEKHIDECKQLEELFISEEQEKEAVLEGATKAPVEEETEDVEQLEAESESGEETSQVPKQSGFRQFRFLGWFMALSLGYLLVSATFSGLSIHEESPFHIPKGIKEFAKANNLEELSEKLWTLTESSLVYMDKMIPRLGEEYAPLQFHNLTYEKVKGEDDYENELEEESDGEENSEVVEDGEAESNEQTEMTAGTDIESKEGEENLEALVIEEPEVILPKGQEKLESGSTRKDQEEIEAIKVQQKKETALADAESESEDGLRKIAPESNEDQSDAESESEESFREILHPEVRSFNKAMIVLSSTVLVLLAAVAFLFAKTAKPVAESAPETVKLNLANVPVKEKLYPLNVQAEEEEVDDKKSNKKDPKEHQSLGGGNSKLRRESMASSASEYSVGSFSYGSFTTYEKIPIKTGDGEEEMVTPVRRSSRIRKHHQPSSNAMSK